MNRSRTLGFWIVALAFFTLGSAAARAQSFKLVCVASGNWNAAGIHTPSNYQIGYSTELPQPQAAYFVFNFTSIKGRTVTGCNLLIPGSTDYSITGVWTGHTPVNQFKVGAAPQNVTAMTISQIMTTNHNKTLYTNASDANRNQDLGYAWVTDGLHKGFTFDAFHYNTARLQSAVNAGGLFAFWVCDRYDSGAGSENYIWGQTAYNTGIICNITVN